MEPSGPNEPNQVYFGCRCSKYPIMFNQFYSDTVLKPSNLIRFRVQQIINEDGFYKEDWRGFRKFELARIQLANGTAFIQLRINGMSCPGGWYVAEQDIHAQLPVIKLKDEDGNPTGQIKRVSPMMVFYAIGLTDHKKYRYLYLSQQNGSNLVGTRGDLRTKYISRCMSKKQRHAPELELKRKRREARKQRKIEKRFRQRYPIQSED
jgi:hypothetical protein